MSATTFDLSVQQIVVRDRLRKLDQATVDGLAVAIEESGFFGSITVRPLRGNPREPRYQLVAGLHRLEAVKKLGWSTIPATVKPMSDPEALKVEIDENLVRRGLTPLERAEFYLARAEVYGQLYPERIEAKSEAIAPKRGRPKNSDKMSELLKGVPITMGFAADTAAELDVTERTVRRHMEIAKGVPVALRERLHGSWIAKNANALRQLAGVEDAALQAKAAEILLEGRTKSVADALAYAGGNTPIKAEPASVSALQAAFDKLWKAASATERADLIAGLAARKLPGDWALIPSDAPEFAAYQARVNPAAIDADDLLQGFDDE
ncbi:MAG: ParB/RepB/Spo0J family partition protein [Phenylobacterium sp.]|uniref:ParB/RepB/Spo0J family partition protein n=1 Tax=Phenylobacterium sp. TaxID=1871053 RepID=UPI003918F5D3